MNIGKTHSRMCCECAHTVTREEGHQSMLQVCQVLLQDCYCPCCYGLTEQHTLRDYYGWHTQNNKVCIPSTICKQQKKKNLDYTPGSWEHVIFGTCCKIWSNTTYALKNEPMKRVKTNSMLHNGLLDLMNRSTCFGHYYAHRQELATIQMASAYGSSL